MTLQKLSLSHPSLSQLYSIDDARSCVCTAVPVRLVAGELHLLFSPVPWLFALTPCAAQPMAIYAVGKTLKGLQGSSYCFENFFDDDWHPGLPPQTLILLWLARAAALVCLHRRRSHRSWRCAALLLGVGPAQHSTNHVLLPPQRSRGHVAESRTPGNS
jgi:hypothetical protein